MQKLSNIFYLSFLVLLLISSCSDSDSKDYNEKNQIIVLKLPIYGQKEFIEGVDEDTIYHTIPSFSFVNQNGEIITEKKFVGKPYVSYFFFASCPSICPKMTNNMKYFQEQTADLEIKVIAHTVDPDRDSVATLKAYADEHEISSTNFDMVTGVQSEIYELGVLGYMVPNQEDALAPGGFLHSEKIMLIDSKSRVRGFYNATDKDAIDQLIIDIKKLIADESSQ